LETRKREEDRSPHFSWVGPRGPGTRKAPVKGEEGTSGKKVKGTSIKRVYLSSRGREGDARIHLARLFIHSWHGNNRRGKKEVRERGRNDKRAQGGQSPHYVQGPPSKANPENSNVGLTKGEKEVTKNLEKTKSAGKIRNVGGKQLFKNHGRLSISKIVGGCRKIKGDVEENGGGENAAGFVQFALKRKI